MDETAETEKQFGGNVEDVNETEEKLRYGSRLRKQAESPHEVHQLNDEQDQEKERKLNQNEELQVLLEEAALQEGRLEVPGVGNFPNRDAHDPGSLD